MNIFAKTLAVLAVVATVTPAVLADDDSFGRGHRNWNHGTRVYTSRYGATVYPGYTVNRARRWNYDGYNGYNNNVYPGYINNGVGADGYPAWMGGYRPRRGW